MDEAIAIQPGAETAGNACGIKAEFEMFLFALLGLSKCFLDPAAWHELAEGDGLTLLFDLLAFFGCGQRGGLSRIRVAAHAFVIPAVEQFYIDIELIQNPCNRLVDNLIQGFRSMIKSGYRRKDHRTRACQCHHRFKMSQVKRCFTDDENEFLALFQYDVSCAHQQVAADGMRNTAHRLHRTRSNDHALSAK